MGFINFMFERLIIRFMRHYLFLTWIAPLHRPIFIRDFRLSQNTDFIIKFLLIHNFPVIIFTILAPKTSSETFGIWIKFSSQCSKTKAMWCNKCWRNWNLVLQPLPIPRDSSKSCEIWEIDSRSSLAKYFFGCFEESFDR